MSDKASKLRRLLLLALIAAFVGIEIYFRLTGSEGELRKLIYQSSTRIVGGLVCVVFMLEFSLGRVLNPLGNKKATALFAVLPAFVVAVNNFPFVSLATGDCKTGGSVGVIAAYALFCLSVGFFEEMAFRGCALMILLKSRTKTRLGIFIAICLSSVVFGLVHLLNLLEASAGYVFLQMGYSALIGALCSVVLLETGNIWLCVALHSIYNFAGGVVASFGYGVVWTPAEVAVTAVIGVGVTVYTVWRFFKIPLENVDRLFKREI